MASNRLIGFNVVSVGTLTPARVHPGELFEAAVLANANAVVLVHNHRSGDLEPSAEERALTDAERLKQAGEIIGIKILAHVVIGDGTFVSIGPSIAYSAW